MKKRFISAALAVAMVFGSLSALAACNGPEQDTGDQNGPNQNQNTQKPETPEKPIKPGTVITDEKITGEIFGAVSEAELSGFTYSASIGLDLSSGETSQIKISAEGAVSLSEEISADVYLVMTDPDGTGYNLFYLRGDNAYTLSGDGADGDVDFASVKAQLKAEEDPLVLSSEGGEGLVKILSRPAAVKIARNLPALGKGVVTKSEGGFSLAYDILEAAGDLLAGLETLAEKVEETAEMTVSGLFGQPFVSETLQKLLKGVTAEEMRDLIAAAAPEIQLPAAETKATAVQYLESCLRSGTFFAALTEGFGEENPFADWQTIGEVPLSALVSFFSDGETDLGSLGLKDMLGEFGDKLEEKIVESVFSLLSLPEGEITGENVDFALGFSFDEDKKLLGFSLEGTLAGARQTGEDKATLGGTFKLEAATAASPQMFDLAGCKYYDAEGEQHTIPGKVAE